jgi:multicomponent Na+:H+ antiporter subunit B
MSPDSPRGMSPIVRTVTRWITPLALVYGIQLVLYGHLTPGGGFSGGSVIACAFVLVMLAEGRTPGRRIIAELDSAGALMFLAVAILGTAFAGMFFRNFIATPEGNRFTLFSAGTIPLSNIAIGLKVGCSLALVSTVLAAFHLASRGRGEDAATGRDDE